MIQHVCRSCGSKIIWAVTAAGKRMPLDPEPVHAGNIILRERARGLEPEAVYVKPDPDESRYISHFVTCPQARKWRKQQHSKGKNH
jgi:hypothetical protein